MARRAGLLRSRLNERTLLSWAQTNESLRATDSSSPVIAVMQPAHALLANHRPLFQRACPASRRLLVQPEVGSVVVIQVDNATPIVLNREKSFTLGILGTTALWRSTNPSPGMGVPCSAAASKRTSKLDSWRSRNGCSIRRPAAE